MNAQNLNTIQHKPLLKDDVNSDFVYPDERLLPEHQRCNNSDFKRPKTAGVLETAHKLNKKEMNKRSKSSVGFTFENEALSHCNLGGNVGMDQDQRGSLGSNKVTTYQFGSGGPHTTFSNN